MERTPGIHLGDRPVAPAGGPPTGRLVRAFGEEGYLLEDVQALRPFLTTLVSASDHWLFAASNGGLTAGRASPATALFPYVTEDKLIDAPGVSGPVTALLVRRGGGPARLWRPLAAGDGLLYRCTRRLFKSALGTRLVFEEENHDLGLTFRAGWQTSERFGFVRECALVERAGTPAAVAILDGLLDLMPGDADEGLQRSSSCLLDAYKQAERLPGSTLALFTLAAQVVDRPEPREALHATTVWSHGLEGAEVLLADEARAAFERGLPLAPADEVRGRRGCYLVRAGLELPAGGERGWRLVADVSRTQAQVADLVEGLRRPEALVAALGEDVAAGVARLEQVVAGADAAQLGADRLATTHHLANVLFNGMRGGVYAGGGAIPGRDFEAFVRGANRQAWARQRAFLAALPEAEPRAVHRARVDALGDPDLTRLSMEYLPLTFSRRHGDPSRPWNRFSIQVRDASGAPRLDFQGNWRDIFQNWEALSRSAPGFVEQIVAKFVNASTADGHNPYRIGRGGIDWEVPEPDHPWSTIGYWGDHQLVYLARLLELSLDHHPDRLPALLERPLFTYADVPYRLRPYADIAADPRATILFDRARHAEVTARAAALGSDGRLLHRADALVRVTLAEKLLVPALAKLANLVPGGGVWMNTQRPEWNDANNALAGWGLSVVTLCHLERYLALLARLLAPLAGRATPISPEVNGWLEATLGALDAHRATLQAEAVDDQARARVTAALGEAASRYREGLYARGLSPAAPAPADRLLALCQAGGEACRQSLRLARRGDGLFHAYNVLAPRPGGALGVAHLDEMLEGQVAALGTGALDDEAACALLDALPRSRLWRADQRSYLLYPDKRLPRFLEKNVLPEAALQDAPLLARALERGDGRLVLRDAAGRLRFGPGLHNAEACAAVLRALAEEGLPGVDAAAVAQVLAAYEAVFHHHAFTGRSGSMFAYEGLGSIYWHMVGKLLLAVQERFTAAAEAGAPAALLERYAAHYRAIQAGMGGAEKTPAEWGAFPLDPYSHTPAGGGARQPGMTGQVKEEILIRLGELGVRVREGRIAFRPRLLRRAEFLAEPAVFEATTSDGARARIPLEAGALAFTLCQVPVVYRLGGTPRLRVTASDGAVREVEGDVLDAGTSAAIFERTRAVVRLEAWVTPGR